jgi:hypothetical protein
MTTELLREQIYQLRVLLSGFVSDTNGKIRTIQQEEKERKTKAQEDAQFEKEARMLAEAKALDDAESAAAEDAQRIQDQQTQRLINQMLRKNRRT